MILKNEIILYNTDQEYFFSKEWQNGESDADLDIVSGNIIGPFGDIDSALKALKKI